MHLQNRVTPFGDIVAIPQRGMFTGNRGIIHDPATKSLLSRRWASKTWLVCGCEYKGRHRKVMAGRSWTELFFLDEAIALSAGHRPCFLCRRAAAKAFRAAWASATGAKEPSAAAIDDVLHRERLDRGQNLSTPCRHRSPSCRTEQSSWSPALPIPLCAVWHSVGPRMATSRRVSSVASTGC